jgi:hypothetical protein
MLKREGPSGGIQWGSADLERTRRVVMRRAGLRLPQMSTADIIPFAPDTRVSQSESSTRSDSITGNRLEIVQQ